MALRNVPTSSVLQRRARTRSLIQLGGLLEHAGILDIFNIPLGVDLQKDESVKNNIAALFKALLIINEMVASKELDLDVLALQGLQAFKDKGLSELRPLDRQKHKEIEAHSDHRLAEDRSQDDIANDNSDQNQLRGNS